MRNIVVGLLLVLSGVAMTQTESFVDKNGYSYSTVKNDAFNTRIYTLKNGLTVYLSDYKATPRVQTYIAVKAGSKNDPATHTGLAHYLEHIMFKGTSKIGTRDWGSEEVVLKEIERLYNVYGATRDTAERSAIYHQIDSVSGVAATYAIANEYDKLLSNIGAQGTNAYTWVEQTVYVNEIPSNSIQKWIEIESERFSEVVPRLFHTELEAVYEEKNRGLDSDGRKAWATMMGALFQKHQYGTQTTIGTIEHLKSPSITEIKKYFDTYYCPNNVAICMSGDIDVEQTIQWINQYFGTWKKADIPKYIPAKEVKIKSVIEKTVYGPEAEEVSIGFRFPGVSDKESLMMEFLSMVLSNSQAGLIDLNLNQAQKIQGGYSYPLRMKDYSVHILSGRPKEGQSLEEVRDLLLDQLDKVRKGEIDDWLLEAIINDYKLSKTIESERNKSRADHFVSSFILGMPWEDYIGETKKLEKITKKDLQKFVKRCYKDNYIVVYKRTGKDKVLKVQKPKITPVLVNRDEHSVFYNELFKSKTPSLSPVFIDYDKDIIKGNAGNTPILYKQNVENDLFQLYYVFDIGSRHDKKLALAISYLKYLGTDQYTAEELQKEFYKLGCSYSVSASEDQIYVSLNGLNENLEKALPLFESIFKNVKKDQEAYDNLVSKIIKGRTDSKLSKKVILTKAMLAYAKYGKNSPFIDRLSEGELKNISPSDLVQMVKDLFSFKHKALYYGPLSLPSLSTLLKEQHGSHRFVSVPKLNQYEEQLINTNSVLFVEYDMVQAEVMLISQSVKYDNKVLPEAIVFNEYFGGNMGSIVFQELRESKALAYSVKSYYKTANRPYKHNYIISYIGTQSDKIHEAIEGMQILLDSMPLSQATFDNALQSLKASYETSRVIKSGVLFNYLKAQKMNQKIDIRKDIYNYLQKTSLQEVQSFYQTMYKNKPYTMLVIGSKDKIDLKELERYGKVTELSLEQVFGY